MTKNAVIVVPHEDDMEILGFHTAHNLIKSGFHIYEIVMTDGRFGLVGGPDGGPSKPEFAGERLKRIRRSEIQCAARAYGKDNNGKDWVTVVFMDYVDGFVPLNKRSISRLKAEILKYSPEIVVGMDPFYPIDNHHDHLNTGRNYYFALKAMNIDERPKQMYFIQSYRNDTYIPLGSFKLQEKVLNCHKSQLNPFTCRLISHFTPIFYLIRSVVSRGRPAAGLRRLRFGKEFNTVKTLQERIFHSLCLGAVNSNVKDYQRLYNPRPKLGMGRNEINPDDYDKYDAHNLSVFYFGKEYENKVPLIMRRGKFI